MISLALLFLAFAGWLCAHKRHRPAPLWVYFAVFVAVVIGFGDYGL